MTETLPPTTDRAADDVSDATAIFRGNLINSSDQLAGINTKSFRRRWNEVSDLRARSRGRRLRVGVHRRRRLLRAPWSSSAT